MRKDKQMKSLKLAAAALALCIVIFGAASLQADSPITRGKGSPTQQYVIVEGVDGQTVNVKLGFGVWRMSVAHDGLWNAPPLQLTDVNGDSCLFGQQNDRVKILTVGYAIGGRCKATNPLTLTIPSRVGSWELYTCGRKHSTDGRNVNPKAYDLLCDGQPAGTQFSAPQPWVVVFERLAR